MKNKKILALLVTAMLISVTAVGCGKAKSDEAPASSDSAVSEAVSTVEEAAAEEEEEDVFIPDHELEPEDPSGDIMNPLKLEGNIPGDAEKIEENTYSDNTYDTQYLTADGMCAFYEYCFPATLDGMEADEEYAQIVSESIVEKECRDITVTEVPEYSDQVGNKVYVVSYTTGKNEDTRIWNVFSTTTQDFSYIFAFSTPADYLDEAKPMIEEVFSSLELVEYTK